MELEAAKQFCKFASGKYKKDLVSQIGIPNFAGNARNCWCNLSSDEEIWFYSFGAHSNWTTLHFKRDQCISANLSTDKEIDVYAKWRIQTLQKWAPGKTTQQLYKVLGLPNEILKQDPSPIKDLAEAPTSNYMYDIGPATLLSIDVKKNVCVRAREALIGR